MRIATPQNAAFLPDGSGAGGGSGLPLVATYELVETVNADFGPTTANIFVPENGLYLIAAFSETVTAAAAGQLDVTVDQPGAPLAIIFYSLSLTVAGLIGGYNGVQNIIPVQSTYGVITISRTVTGLAGGPTTYRITAVAYKIC